MATPTTIRHTREDSQTAQFFPYNFVVREMNDTDGRFTAEVASGKCAYEAAEGGTPGMFQEEAMVGDNISIPSWRPEIQAKQHVTVSKGSWSKLFVISDVVPIGPGPNHTLLVVTPKD
jgi:hypothetical protein